MLLDALRSLRPALSELPRESVRRSDAAAWTGRRPIDVFEKVERAALRPLPAGPHDCGAVRTAVADSRFRVSVDGNRYSVPSSAATHKVEVSRYADRVVIRSLDGELLADHPRCFGRHQEVVDQEHGRALVLKMRHAHDRKRLTRFLTLGSEARSYLEALREKRPSWRSHVNRINSLAETHGRDEMARCLAAAAESVAADLTARGLTVPGGN